MKSILIDLFEVDGKGKITLFTKYFDKITQSVAYLDGIN